MGGVLLTLHAFALRVSFLSGYCEGLCITKYYLRIVCTNLGFAAQRQITGLRNKSADSSNPYYAPNIYICILVRVHVHRNTCA